MSSEPMRDPRTDPLLTPANSALVVIDYQPNQINTVKSTGTELMTPVRVTFAVDSLREFEASLKSLGFAILQPPTRRTTGSNILVRDADGGVFEFAETRTLGP
jgi:hypothetical protein